MTVNTKQVTDRRTLRFTALDDIIADAEVLRAHGYRRLGNWSLGQVCDHLARLMHVSIEGTAFRLPWWQRLLLRPLRARMLRRGFPAGVPLEREAAALLPGDEISDADGLEALHRAINRLRTDPTRHPSPVLGPLSRAQWDQFHCRHAEHHLSFLVPER
ncbi:MAG: DUF1569 domain-containing protein [Phycisphaeraceae bacterium]